MIRITSGWSISRSSAKIHASLDGTKVINYAHGGPRRLTLA